MIEDGAFIGSDTQLVAPVRVGKRAVIGAGTTVTRDVPAGALALSRVAQIEKPGYAQRWREQYAGPGTAPVRLDRGGNAAGAGEARPRQRR